MKRIISYIVRITSKKDSIVINHHMIIDGDDARKFITQHITTIFSPKTPQEKQRIEDIRETAIKNYNMLQKHLFKDEDH